MELGPAFSNGSKVIFVNWLFFPDHSATSQILSDLAFHLVTKGRSVHVITSRQRYDDPDAGLPPAETIQGVRVHRVFTSSFGRGRLLGRAVDYLCFYLGSLWVLWRLARRGDIVVAETDPPLLSVVLAPIVRLRGARLVTWLQDLFPEVASALGVRLFRGRVGRWVGRLRDASLRCATMNVVLGERERAFLLRRGVPDQQIRTIHNWTDDDNIQPIPRDPNSLRKQWGLEGKFVVEYSGNLGRVHEAVTFLEAAVLLGRPEDAEIPAGGMTHEDAADVVFLFIGGGHRYAWLQQEVSRRGLSNVMFRPYQERKRLVESLGLGDVHLISLLPAMECLIVPSKFYGIVSAGRPILFVGDPRGEIGRLLSLGKCGATVTPGDAAGLAAWILRLQSDPHLRPRWGANARRLLDERFRQEKAFDSWDEVIAKEVMGGRKGSD